MKNISINQLHEKARYDLRLGIPIIFIINNKQYLISALETINQDFFQLYKNYEIIISPTRAKLLWNINTKSAIRFQPKKRSCSLDEITNLSFDDFNLPLSVDMTKSLPEDLEIIKFIKSAELLPCAVITEVIDHNIKDWCNDNNIIELEYHNVTQQANDITIQKICQAPLVLKEAENSHIIVYRHNAKDHYAIIVGSPDLQNEPLVRIHSSCYTGDLLNSLTCDCGGQLRSAIDLMANNKGGIILYLSQEGRDIGLTNKLRAYFQQSSNNFDTVDANRYLGFEDDERNFQVAAKILKNLNINSIKLITNNSNKALQLRKNGINIASNINSTIKYNKYNMHYLYTKLSKLGHVIKY